ncbi:putative signal peptide protein [Puccinia sorghi]|uniref:Putative signal peptide protein n=1 Tax=Puccinia sorghi TaxID=27349 RepID=A0A0L6VC61_9BASI|nr:putative signal peptide protein [Puccinia sorghi]
MKKTCLYLFSLHFFCSCIAILLAHCCCINYYHN